jgi:hypothetical protein
MPQLGLGDTVTLFTFASHLGEFDDLEITTNTGCQLQGFV